MDIYKSHVYLSFTAHFKSINQNYDEKTLNPKQGHPKTTCSHDVFVCDSL